MNLTYCEKWSQNYNEARGLRTETDAKCAHEQRKLYTVLFGDIKHPSCFFQVLDEAVTVGFLDEHLRCPISYGFQEVSPGKLFLSQAHLFIYDDESEIVKSGTHYYFQKDGHLVIEFIEYRNNSVLDETRSLKEMQTDVSGNWEPYPEFGKYDSIIRRDRGLPVLQVPPISSSSLNS